MELRVSVVKLRFDMVTTEALSSHGDTETIERSATLPLRSLARDNYSNLTSQSSEIKIEGEDYARQLDQRCRRGARTSKDSGQTSLDRFFRRAGVRRMCSAGS